MEFGNKTYDCACGKQYKHRQSLYTHKKKCDKAKQQSSSFTDEDYEDLLNNITDLRQEVNKYKNYIRTLKKVIKDLKDKYETSNELTEDTDKEVKVEYVV